MSRRAAAVAITIAVALACLAAIAVVWRLASPRAVAPTPPTTAPVPPAAPAAAPAPEAPARPSTIIDLPGDPALVQRGAVGAPRQLTVALPTRLAADAPKVESEAFYFSAPLVSTTGGYLGKYPENGQEADGLAAQLAMNAAQLAGSASAAELAAGADDDGGDDTPDNAGALAITDANSNQIAAVSGGADGRPQIKQTILKPAIGEKIGDLLTANGFEADSARSVENAAKARFNFQSLPAGGVALAIGQIDATGAYRVAQFAIYEDRDYVGAIALGENGLYGEGAQPSVPPGLLDDAFRPTPGVRFNLADGVYSAGLRSAAPEPVVREAVQLLARMIDLKAPLAAAETLRVLYTRKPRGKSPSASRIVYAGLAGAAGTTDCYVFELADGSTRCFNPKEAAAPSPPLPPTLGESGAIAVGGILAPIKGAPITSLFGTRFHPILHIWRLHAGIDFGAAVGSQVRAAADGAVEIAGPVRGYGNHVMIKHDGYETSYSHLSEIPGAIKPGVKVKQGEIIALSGNTGLSTGPHLHFEFHVNGVAVDPMPHLGKEAQIGAATASASPAIALQSSGPSDKEIAVFPAAKALVDAALAEAAR